MSATVRPAWLDLIVIERGTKPADRQVFVATCREILLLEDVDGDDRCDRQTRLVWLDTKGTTRTTAWRDSPSIPWENSSSASAKTWGTVRHSLPRRAGPAA